MAIAPQLWPPIIGAALGLPIIIICADWLLQRRKKLSARKLGVLTGALALFTLLLGITLYAYFIEPNQLVVRRVTIVSEHWRGAPITIAAIGDTHVGSPHMNARRLESIVEKIDDLHPDMVVLLGDYVPGHAPAARHPPAEQAEVMRGLAAFAVLNAPLGVVAVIGNHDVWYGRSVVTQALDDAGVATLWNRNVVISRQGGDLVIAGIADDWTGHPDFNAALDGAPDADTIVLSHSPDPFPDMPARVALMIAAHTHCGQVTIPLFGRPIVPSRFGQRYACGRVDENGHTLYVTGGLGTSGPPVRFLNPPEIVLITVRGAAHPRP